MNEDKKDSVVRRAEPEAADAEGHKARWAGPEDVVKPRGASEPASEDTEGHAVKSDRLADATHHDTEGHAGRIRPFTEATDSKTQSEGFARPGRLADDTDQDTEGHGRLARSPEGFYKSGRVAEDTAEAEGHADGAVVDGEDTEGHRRLFKGTEDRAEGQEAPKGPGDPDEGRTSWSDRNMKRGIVPVRW